MQVISLSVMVFCFALVKSTPYETNGNDVRIFRGKRDIFTRTVGCNDSNAVCFNETCTYCQCMVNQTFLRTRGPYGQCVSNELVVYATSDEDYFLLQSVRHKRCLYQTSTKWGTFVFVSTTCSHDNENSRWIWTNYGQLLNWKTMECMTDGLLFRQEHLVTMKKCDRRNQKQLWECVGDKKYNIRQTQSRKDLYFGEHRQYVTTSWSTARKWVRHGSNKDFCSKGVGCEKFADGSSLIILNETKCEEQSKCLGEKVISMNGTKCFVLPNKTQYLHNNKWEAMEIKTGSFAMFSSMDKVSLKWNLRKVPNSWKGLMVKVRFMCEDGADKTEHCVVVKLMGTFTGFRKGGGEDSDDSGKDDGKVGDSKAGADNGDMVNKDKIDVDQESKGGDRDNTKTIIIIVCVLVVVLLSGVIVFIIYRHRHGRTRSKRGYKGRQCNATILDEVQPSTTNQPAQRESQLYEVPCERHYEYVDKTAIILPQTFTYDYASVDGTLENDRELRVKPVITEEGDYVNKKTDTEDRDTHDDYVIKIPDTEDRNTHDDYVIKKPDTEDKDMHDDYVIKKPDTEDKDMHDDYVIKKPDTEDKDMHDDYVIKKTRY